MNLLLQYFWGRGPRIKAEDEGRRPRIRAEDRGPRTEGRGIQTPSNILRVIVDETYTTCPEKLFLFLKTWYFMNK